MVAAKKPWNRENPKKKTGERAKKLTADQKASANAAAKRAGRKYPNLATSA